jgi:teichuronic acid exporter
VILIGRYMGAEALGIYNLAYQIVTIPVLKINPIITRVAFPVFSKSQQNQVLLTDGFLHMTKLLSLVCFPILMGLTAVSNVFILTIFGQKWLDAVPILQIMAIVGILRVLMNPNGSVILAKGKANIAFYWDAGVLILYGASLWLAVMTNKLEVVAWAYAGVSLVNFLVGRWLLNWLIQLRFRQYMKTISIPFLLSLLITVVAFCLKEISVFYFPQTSIWPLIFSVGISTVVYIFLLYKMYPHFFLKIIKKQIRGQT